MATLTARQLSELVPCAADDVERLQQLGLVTPDEEGLFPSSDVHVVRLMGAFETAGISLEAVAKGVAGGEFSFPMGLLLPEPAPGSRRTKSSGRVSTGRPSCSGA